MKDTASLVPIAERNPNCCASPESTVKEFAFIALGYLTSL